ncbi:MAG: hypothetical protein HY717_10895 [Planctomycetes bacterium]|nr:hypothetical protein [Planctomycetota bacterium]
MSRAPLAPLAALVATFWSRSAVIPDESVSYQDPVQVGKLASPLITECSGIAASRKSPGAFWVHNDSGDAARLFAIDQTGKLLAIVEFSGIEAGDWEDIAMGPGPVKGEDYLYIADTGNNGLSRADLRIHRLPEPSLRKVAAGGVLKNPPPPVEIRFTYQDGSHDCEALAVHPRTGDLYLFTKKPFWFGVYRLKAPVANPKPMVAERVAQMSATDLVTAADLSVDGRRLVIRTYFSLVEYSIGENTPFEEIFKTKGVYLKAPPDRQGESACYSLSGSILTISEGLEAPIFELAPKTAPAR